MDLQELNQVANLESRSVLKPSDLVIDKIYEIITLKSTFSRKLQKRILIAELTDGIIFLPDRIQLMITEEVLLIMNTAKHGLIFHGYRDVNKLHKATLFEFIKLE